MSSKWAYFHLLLVIVLILLTYKYWFLRTVITAGDFWPFYSSMYLDRALPLSAWDFNGGYGLGGFTGPFLWIFLNLATPITLLGKFLGLPWFLVERLGFMYPFILLTFISPFLLAKYILKSSSLALLSACIYLLNTYALMIAGGGQFAGVGMGYALLPLVILFVARLMENKKQKLEVSIVAGLVFGMQIIYDIRFAYIGIFASIVLVVLNLKHVVKKENVIKIFIVAVIAILLNLFWLLPSLVVHQNPFDKLGSAYSSIDAVKFFSFAKLENTISLLHPNWPENIFGKVGFMRPEFLILPILAFGSLLYVSKIKKRFILGFFIVIGLVGAFLAKGANEPLGNVYIFAFQNIPGFQLFRDSTKWYALVALSYSILIPFFVDSLANTMRTSNRSMIKNMRLIVVGTIILYFIILIKPALFGELRGAFKPVTIPDEYLQLEKQLASDNTFYRTLWIPNYQRFSYYSAIHPSISGNDFLKTKSSGEAAQRLQSSNSRELLEYSSVRYVVVPFDSEKELFLKDRKYDDSQRKNLIMQLKQIPWLDESFEYKDIVVFEILNFKDHFWSPDKNIIMSNSQNSVTQYTVTLANVSKGSTLVFSESFDKNWIAKKDKTIIRSSEFEGLNSFVLPIDGSYNLIIEYKPQTLVHISSVVSFVTFVVLMLYLFRIALRKINK